MDTKIYNDWLIDWLIDWLKTQSDFHTPSNLKPLDGDLLNTYFFNIHEEFTAKQANLMGNFAEVLAESQSENFDIISI